MKIEDRILSIVQENTEHNGNVTLASDLRKELRLDSFGTLMIINAIEEGFGVTVDQDDFCTVTTVADIVTLLRSKYQCN